MVRKQKQTVSDVNPVVERESVGQDVQDKLDGQRSSDKQRRYMTILRYLLGGMLTYGLLGACIGWIVNMGWLWVLGVIVGVLGGVYLSYKHELLKTKTV